MVLGCRRSTAPSTRPSGPRKAGLRPLACRSFDQWYGSATCLAVRRGQLLAQIDQLRLWTHQSPISRLVSTWVMCTFSMDFPARPPEYARWQCRVVWPHLGAIILTLPAIRQSIQYHIDGSNVSPLGVTGVPSGTAGFHRGVSTPAGKPKATPNGSHDTRETTAGQSVGLVSAPVSGIKLAIVGPPIAVGRHLRTA